MKLIALILVFVLQFAAFAVSNDSLPPVEERLKIQEGVASFYARKFHLRKTASGEVYNMEELTAAHKYLPFGTMLKVTNLKNGKEVWVKVNDRLPQSSKRIIDLSKAAAQELDMVRDGIVKVRVEVPDEETIISLLEHFQDEKPEDLRLRLYENPIPFERPCIFSLSPNFSLESTLLAMN
ncbi:septal ring lytic transglycosylase RlpA family protein [Cecembia rubra]|uniref:septal ring lytic transglycosylase RlpA family protein n=1 Tax=Cecembia rubra TaxID=1485585 RepID=UPI002714A07D|nr:septal ring lytic transglycosylase RlpA family protein [Cecembia rubra]